MTKECTKCRLIKSTEDFYLRPGSQSKPHSWCKECEAQRRKAYYQLNKAELYEKQKERQQDNSPAGKERRRRRKERERTAHRNNPQKKEEQRLKIKSKDLHKKYKITHLQYQERLDAQGQRCTICMVDLDLGRDTHVDHDHTTGEIRGILCKNCNTGLGQFKDSPELLRRAALYLESVDSSLETPFKTPISGLELKLLTSSAALVTAPSILTSYDAERSQPSYLPC